MTTMGTTITLRSNDLNFKYSIESNHASSKDKRVQFRGLQRIWLESTIPSCKARSRVRELLEIQVRLHGKSEAHDRV